MSITTVLQYCRLFKLDVNVPYRFSSAIVLFPEPQVDMVPSAQVHLTKLWHVVGGLYIWEYFTTLDYEWRVIRRQLPYRWTIWIYSLSRFSALLSIILFFVIMDVTTPINCQSWMLCSIFFLCLSSINASLLIVIRTIAIWNRNKVVVALAMSAWGITFGFHIHNLVRIRIKWISSEQACVHVRSDPSVLGFIPTIAADMALLLIILTGLLVLRHNDGGKFGLARLLWRQGFIWLVLGSAIDIPPLVFSFLHLNDQLPGLFELPCLIVMTISATRMHRSLVDFASGSTEVTHENLPLSNLVFSKTKRRTDTVPTTLDGINVSVNRAIERGSTGSKNDGSCFTVFGTSEKIPQTTGDPSKIDLTQASDSLPTVSSSPVLEAESV